MSTSARWSRTGRRRLPTLESQLQSLGEFELYSNGVVELTSGGNVEIEGMQVSMDIGGDIVIQGPTYKIALGPTAIEFSVLETCKVTVDDLQSEIDCAGQFTLTADANGTSLLSAAGVGWTAAVDKIDLVVTKLS